MYGYKIIKELELQSESMFELKEGTLYPILHALEEENLLESSLENLTAESVNMTTSPAKAQTP